MTSEDEAEMTVGTGFPAAQMARALVTALTDRDEDVRRRAGDRVGRWGDVLAGMRDGRLRVGTRTPVRDLPAWVTTEVLHGGFATGHAAAALDRSVPPAEWAARFDHHLTESGLAELVALLESGEYRVDVPEEAALLAVAALVRGGEAAAALDVVAAVRPYADRLRFVPVPAPRSDVPDGVVCRADVAALRSALAGRRVPDAILAERETLTVWNPLADALLELWSGPDAPDAPVGALAPSGTDALGVPDARDDRAWRERAAELLARFDAADRVHPRCRARRRRGNLAGLRAVTADALAGTLTAGRLGRARVIVRDMVRKRGEPGSARLAAVRAQQARQAALPTHADVAGVLLRRLAHRTDGRGLADPDAVVAPVAEWEDTALPAGTVVPPALRRIVRRSAEGTPDQLVAAGAVPSSEVLAGLAPAVVAARIAAAYPDPVVRRLVAAGERAFASRRSVLLTDLSHQVRSAELPWMAALTRLARPGADTGRAASDAARDLGRLALESFPGTVTPNPLVSRLRELTRTAGTPMAWTDELAADIFVGYFSMTFAAAARTAAELLAGTPYALYYGLDVADLPPESEARRVASGTRVSAELTTLCVRRAGTSGPRSVVDNGRMIEQAQILTTHNLATLAGPLGVRPSQGWMPLAHGAMDHCVRLVLRGRGLSARGRDGRPAVRRAAFAWRQMLFFVSLAGRDGEPGSGPAFGEHVDAVFVGVPALAAEFADLRAVLAGHRVDPADAFVGWSSAPHRLLTR